MTQNIFEVMAIAAFEKTIKHYDFVKWYLRSWRQSNCHCENYLLVCNEPIPRHLFLKTIEDVAGAPLIYRLDIKYEHWPYYNFNAQVYDRNTEYSFVCIANEIQKKIVEMIQLLNDGRSICEVKSHLDNNALVYFEKTYNDMKILNVPIGSFL